MRIVLDTNVVLSALLWRGTPHHLLATIGQRSSIQLYSSTALLEELADVFTRPSATKRLALIGRSAREVLADYVEAIELVEPASVPRVVLGDVDDDQVIAAAVAARACGHCTRSCWPRSTWPSGRAPAASPARGVSRRCPCRRVLFYREAPSSSVSPT